MDDSVENEDLFKPFLFYAAVNAGFVIFGASLVTYVEVIHIR